MRASVPMIAIVGATVFGAAAETYVVNPAGTGDFPTIQTAVEAASDRDVIELAAGTFRGAGNRDVVISGKTLTIRSQSGDPESCTIDCEMVASALRILEGSACQFAGFKVQHGRDNYGGGASCRQSCATFSNCNFNSNRTESGGAAVYCLDGIVAFEGCVFLENSAMSEYGTAMGGALKIERSGAELSNCTFFGNYALGEALGGAIYATESDLGLQCCILADNVAYGAFSEGGAIYSTTGDVHLTSCTLFGNAAQWASGIVVYRGALSAENTMIVGGYAGSGGGAIRSDATPSLSCCDIWNNRGGDWTPEIEDQLGVNGNISADPLFCRVQSYPRDFRLQNDSPCRPFPPGNPQCDLIGALPVGCGESPTQEKTWGGVKVLFR